MPKISVIMPVYNKAAYVEKAINSVLEQPFDDLELIVVNDGSKDQSLTLVQGIADRDARVRVLDVPNGGVSSARNIGLEHAQGEWIQFLDADDILERAYLSKAMKVLDQTPADILFTGFTMVDEQMHPVKQVALPVLGELNQSQLCDCFIHHQYKSGFFGYISNKLFRRSLLEESGAEFPVGVTLAEDLDFYAKLYPAVKRAYFLEENSFLYLQTQQNYLYNTKIDYFSQLQIHIDIRTWMQRSGMYEKHRTILDQKIAQYAYYILFYANEERTGLEKAFYDLCKREDVMPAIRSEYGSGFMCGVLHALSRKNLLELKALFALRNALRRLYRIVRRT